VTVKEVETTNAAHISENGQILHQWNELNIKIFITHAVQVWQQMQLQLLKSLNTNKHIRTQKAMLQQHTMIFSC